MDKQMPSFGSVAAPCRVFIVLALVASVVILSGCGSDESTLLYRLPYENNINVDVWQDHVTHSPVNRVDLKGINDSSPYAIVASATGIVRFIEDDLTQNCCGGNCGNNYVWLEHIAGEWTKYSHLATDSVRGDAGLTEGDLVIAGQFLGWESNIGRACGSGMGVHLHTEVMQPSSDNPSIIDVVGQLSGTNKIPRYCGVPGQILDKDEVYRARHCDLILECIRSEETPETEGQCQNAISGETCVQLVDNLSPESHYVQGVDFDSTSLHIELDWCPNASCDDNVDTGRALRVLVQPADMNEDSYYFIANCNSRKVDEVVHGVASITIQEAPNLSPENVACGGNNVHNAYGRWEICEVSPFFESMMD